MLLDKELMFSSAQVVTTAAATASTNYLDMTTAGDPGVGEEMWAVGLVREAVTASGGAANVTFAIQVDDNDSFSTPTTIFTTGAIAKATLVLGYRFMCVRLPPIPAGAKERYMRALITPDTNDLTTGKFDIFLTRNVDLLPATPYPRSPYAQF